MRRLIRSFGYAFSGFGHGLRTQANLRIHVQAAAGVIIAGLLLQISTIEWAILAVTIMIVMSANLFNTSIEAVIDRVGDEPHPLSKDCQRHGGGSGAYRRKRRGDGSCHPHGPLDVDWT